MSEADRLKLVALDDEDLAIVSAHVQDAVLKVKDLVYLPKEQRFVLAMNRFTWEKEDGRRREHERRQAALGLADPGQQLDQADRRSFVLSRLRMRLQAWFGSGGGEVVQLHANAPSS